MKSLTVERGTSDIEGIWVALRIHAKEREIDSDWLRETLEPNGKTLETVPYADEHEGVAGFEFRNTPALVDSSERARWHQPAFRNAVNWLKSKSIEQFQRIRQGFSVDFCVAGYTGSIPLELLGELVRLQLEIWIIELDRPR